MIHRFCARAAEFSSAAPAEPIPALLTSTSIRPCCAITTPTAAATESSFVTSRSRNVTPFGAVSPVVLRPVPITVKPACASAAAVAVPMPAVAPVTSATGRDDAVIESSLFGVDNMIVL